MSRLEEALKKADEMRQEGKSRNISPAGQPQPQPETKPPIAVRRPFIDIKASEPEKINPLVISLLAPFSPAAEEYKKLRTAVLRAMAARTDKTMLITSPEKGNGKSCTTANLAVAVAATGLPVLLVDADLRRPTLHNYFGIELKGGLSEYLAGEAGMEEIIKSTGIGALSIITAGAPPKNPSEMLSSEGMRHFISNLKTTHTGSLVMLDSSPLLNTAESVSLCQQVDGILLVIEAARTRPAAVKQSLNLLKGLPLMGTVLNNVPGYLSKILHPYYY